MGIVIACLFRLRVRCRLVTNITHFTDTCFYFLKAFWHVRNRFLNAYSKHSYSRENSSRTSQKLLLWMVYYHELYITWWHSKSYSLIYSTYRVLLSSFYMFPATEIPRVTGVGAHSRNKQSYSDSAFRLLFSMSRSDFSELVRRVKSLITYYYPICSILNWTV